MFGGTAHAAPKDEARRYFILAMDQVASGDYDTAVANFLTAYDILPHPAVLYNVGRALADAGEYERSIEFFQQYLATEPIDREEVEGFIGTMVARIDARDYAAAKAARAAEAEATATTRPGTATSAEIAQLEQLAAQLQQLAAAMLQAGDELPLAIGVDGGVSPQVEDAPPAPDLEPVATSGPPELPLQAEDALAGSFLDPYSREVITASRYGQDPLLAPSSITIITSDEIALSGATSIPDLLRRVPGMDVMQPSAGQPEIAIRGFNRRLSNKVLVLIDGRTTYADYLGATFWGTLPISLQDIERIEIIRGVGSALYGAGAFSGVVNIITKAPGDPSIDNLITVAGGTTETGLGSMVLSGRQGALSWRASGGATRLGRWATEGDLEERPDLVSDVEDQSVALDSRQANATLDWRVGESGVVRASAGISQSSGEFYPLGALRDYYFDLRHTYVRMDGAYGPVSVRGYWNRDTGVAGPWLRETDKTDRLSSVISYDLYDLEVRGDHTLGDAFTHRLTGGIGYRFKSADWDYMADELVTENHFSVFLQDESTLGDVHLHAALRIDKHPLQQDVQPSPRIAAVWEFMPGRAIRASAGTAFRNPTFIESYASLYVDTPTSDGVVVNTLGDIALLPERIVSVEAAILDHSSDSWRGEFAGYWNQVDGLIDVGDISAGDHQTSGFNEELGAFVAGESGFENEPGRYRALGAEANFEYFGISGVDAYINYSLERIWYSRYYGVCGYDESKANGESCVDTSTPTHKLNFGFTWRSPYNVDVSVNGNFVSAQTWLLREFDAQGQVVNTPASLDSYLNLSSQVTWHPTDRLDISAAAWNAPALLEAVGPHREHPLGQPVGSRIYGEVRYRF
jgi:iron complex outermembrane receptor protein